MSNFSKSKAPTTLIISTKRILGDGPNANKERDIVKCCGLSVSFSHFTHVNHPFNAFFEKDILSSLQLRENITLFHSKLTKYESLSYDSINHKKTGLSEPL